MRSICLYHRADLDGKCSAAIVRSVFPDIALLGCDYGDDMQALFDQTKDCGRVLVVDFSLPMDLMAKIPGHSHLVWIDHHVSAIKDAEAAGFNPDGIRVIGTAACE
ncbi:MAG: hypothetical protein WC824_11810, partial [Bacteroidota bacterium]